MKSYKVIQKRKEKDLRRKEEKRSKKSLQYDNLDNVITYTNFVKSVNKCKGERFKYSIQRYNLESMENIDRDIKIIKRNEIPKVKNTKMIIIRERGKERTITPIDIKDRVIQKSLCDYALIPAIINTLIYDNGASLKGKGIEFARNRMSLLLEKAKREYECDFYILVFDFKSFFDSISHEVCKNVLDKYFTDKRIVDLTIGTIESYYENKYEENPGKLKELYEHKYKGICLGSQISQILALAVPNAFDHYIKDKLSIKYYIRYMDDGVIILKDKDELKNVLEKITKVAESLQLFFNQKKTKIVKSSKGFTFLKVKYIITKNNRTIKKLTSDGIIRMRRKLKKYVAKVENNDMTLDDVYNSIQSWLSHTNVANSFYTKKRMLKLYDELFGGYRLTKKYFARQRKLERGEITA